MGLRRNDNFITDNSGEMVMRIVFFSNGHGEDIIASVIASALGRISDFEILGLPVVGVGRAYESAGIATIGPKKTMPSGGFVKRNIGFFFKDIRNGLLGLTAEQVSILRKADPDLIVCVGDVYALLLSGLFTRTPKVFLPTAKSDHISPHYGIEIHFMKKYARRVIPRDQLTCDSLRQCGVDAVYLGNAMMDAFEITGEDFDISEGHTVIGLLPEAEIAYFNLKLMLKAVSVLYDKSSVPLEFLVALAPGLDKEKLMSSVGWECDGSKLYPSDAPWKQVRIVQGKFGDVLARSRIVIGMAGTGNEQAVGLGKPVVAFPGDGPQFTKAFLEVQRRLLGDSVYAVMDPEAAADVVLDILQDEDRYNEMARIGRERMGEPGAAERIARFLFDFCKEELA